MKLWQPEIKEVFLLPIPGYCNNYYVDKEGIVYSMVHTGYSGARRVEPKVLKQIKNNSGYLRVALRKKGKTYFEFVHRLVLITFTPNKTSNLQVDHINNIKTDNMLSNLQWLTPKANILKSIPYRKHSKKLTVSHVKFIKSNFQLGVKPLARKFHVDPKTIRSIRDKKIWKHV